MTDKEQKIFNKRAIHLVFGIIICLVGLSLIGLGCMFGGCGIIIPLLLIPCAVISGVTFIILGWIQSKKLWFWFVTTVVMWIALFFGDGFIIGFMKSLGFRSFGSWLLLIWIIFILAYIIKKLLIIIKK